MRLPNFTSSNWTSNLRQSRGFTPYPTEALADFTYEDRYGLLTEWLFGVACKERWREQYPTFYMEVKATMGSVGEPFHMSAKQMNSVSIDGP